MAILLQTTGIRYYLNKVLNGSSFYIRDITHHYSDLGIRLYSSKVRAVPIKNRRLFLLNFNGDISASESLSLSKEVSAILICGDKEKDEVLICIESPGGSVNGYGFAASQVERLINVGFKVTAVVDRIAASGGYMMACVANKIVAGNLAIIGSIGVVAELPNINSLLKDIGIDYHQFTAGKYKRTVSVMAEISDDGKKKFQEDLERTFVIFKDHIQKYRKIDIEKVATGEHWYGADALSLGLIDEIGNSEDLILNKILSGYRVISIQYINNSKRAKRIISVLYNTIASLMMHHKSNLY